MSTDTSSVTLQKIDAKLHGLVKRINSTLRKLFSSGVVTADENTCLQSLGSISEAIEEEATWDLLMQGCQILKEPGIDADAQLNETGLLRDIFVYVIANENPAVTAQDKVTDIRERIGEFNIHFNLRFKETLPIRAEEFASRHNISAPITPKGAEYICSAVLEQFEGKSIAIYSHPEGPVFFDDGSPNQAFAVVGRQIMLEVDEQTGKVQVFAAPNAIATIRIDTQKVDTDISKADPEINGSGRLTKVTVQLVDNGYARYKACRGEPVEYDALTLGETINHAQYKERTAAANTVGKPKHNGVVVDGPSQPIVERSASALAV